MRRSFRNADLTFDFEDGPEQQAKVIDVGYPQAAGLRFGYLTKLNLEVGGSLAITFRSTKQDDGELKDKASEGDYRVHAYARYVLPSERLRFFVGPSIDGQFQKLKDAAEDDDGGDFELSTRLFVIGLEAGCYGFGHAALSLDPFVRFQYAVGSATNLGPEHRRT